MKILVETPVGPIRDTFITQENVSLLESLGTVIWNNDINHFSREEFREALSDVDVCVCGWGVPKFDAYVLEKAHKLRLIAYTCGSVSHIVSDEMYARGIRIVCGNDVFAQSVAEGTLAYMMLAQRRLPQIIEDFRCNGWPVGHTITEGIAKKKVGIVGLGAISRYLIDLLQPFRAEIWVYSRHMSHQEAEQMGVKKAELDELFSSCDIVSVHTARSPANYHMVDDRLLGMLKDGALLVNTARGDIIDEAALAKHLKTGRFRAVLDVYEKEPLPMDSPLWGNVNAILIPHRGGPTIDRRADAARIVIEDIQRFMNGAPLANEVTPDRASWMTRQ